jgi:uncharacterized BrkB/YihY/UPF0761 family membrane protein
MPSLRSALRYFYEHDGFFLAAGLSFYIVICIVPIVLLLIAGSAFLISNEMVLREVLSRLGTLLPVYQAEMEAALRGVIAARGVSSVIGTLILLFFASQLFAATRLVLNRVFQHKGRSFIRGMLFDVGMIILLTVVFLGSIGVTAAFAWVRGMALVVGRGSLVPVALHWAGLLLALLLDTTLFVVVYRFDRPHDVGVLLGDRVHPGRLRDSRAGGTAKPDLTLVPAPAYNPASFRRPPASQGRR